MKPTTVQMVCQYSNLVYNIMCWNSEVNVIVSELKSPQGLENEILHLCAMQE